MPLIPLFAVGAAADAALGELTATAVGTVSAIGPHIRAITTDTQLNVAVATPAKPAGLTAGDYLLAVQVSDQGGTLAAMTAPAGFAELGGNGGPAATTGFMKVWGKVADSGDVAASSFAFPDSTGAHCAVTLIAFETGTVNVGTPLAVSPTFTVNNSTVTAHTAPSATALDESLLVTAHLASLTGAVGTYTAPAGMITRADIFPGGGSPWVHLAVYSETRNAGSTGTRTATYSVAQDYVAMSLVLAAVEPVVLRLPIQTIQVGG